MFNVTKRRVTRDNLIIFWPTLAISMMPVGPLSWTMLLPSCAYMAGFTPLQISSAGCMIWI